MKTFFRSLLAFGLLAGLFAAQPADASQIRMCFGAPAANAAGPVSWKAPTSGTVYSFGNLGCGLVQATDVGDAIANGFVANPPAFALAGLAGGTPNSVFFLPTGGYIDSIVIQETSGGTVTGGARIGTTSGGTDVISTAVVAASTIVPIPDVSMTKRTFSSTAPQQLFIQCGNIATGGTCGVTIRYGFF